ncbi:MAG: pseudouridine synthase, partial [Firmicutes bacterium]|nr:pseudouridine synthase [Bacillota bacterium]
MNGILNILKPPGMTSHDAVDYIRRLAGIKRVGHTGTLDPGAAGVLPLCLGQATRVAEYMLSLPKKYRAELALGAATDTEDAAG